MPIMKKRADQLRILVAIDPLSYREVLAFVLRKRRPNYDVRVVTPYELDSEVASLAPHLVVCNEVTPMVRAAVHSWVQVLAPEGRDAAVQVGQRHHMRVPDMCVDDMLAIADCIKDMTLEYPGRAQRSAILVRSWCAR